MGSEMCIRDSFIDTVCADGDLIARYRIRRPRGLEVLDEIMTKVEQQSDFERFRELID